MWPFCSKPLPKYQDDDWRERMELRRQKIAAFAKIGDDIEYLGVKMLVVSYGHDGIVVLNIPSLNVEYMDKVNRLQKLQFDDDELHLVKNLSKEERG